MGEAEGGVALRKTGKPFFKPQLYYLSPHSMQDLHTACKCGLLRIQKE